MNETTLDNKCPNCAAVLKYNPKLGVWKCDYCDSEFTLAQLQKFSNASSSDNNKESVEETKSEKDNKSKDNIQYITYNCPDCGAEIIADEQTTATFCVYCGNTAILKSKLSGEFRPDKIIPFKKTKEDAKLAYQQLSKGRRLMPKEFNNINNIEKLRGIYIPFWLYNLTTSGNVVIKGTRVHTWVSGNTHYTKTDIYNIEKEGSMSFNLIPADGSSRFDDDIMNSIEPFDYKELVDYNHAYLSGFLAEKYDIDSDKMFEKAADRAKTTMLDYTLDSVSGYDSKVIEENTINVSKDKINYTLLPVWMVNVKYKNKYYIFAMNGQTGEIVGNIPIDKAKFVIYTVVTFMITMLIVILISYIVYKLGGIN